MSYAHKVEGLATLFQGLDGVEGAVSATGAPLEIPLAAIEEDENQPRMRFSEAELDELAASIVARGVRQAITVTPKGEGGRHRILYGARRFRAAQRAGLSTIPAVIREPSPDDAYDQMIENIQREGLTSAEIAAFVSCRIVLGEAQADIARRLGKAPAFVALHAAVAHMPELLRSKIDSAPIRGLYDLYQAWRSQPKPVLAFCESREGFTRAEVTTFLTSLKDASAPQVDPVSRVEFFEVPLPPVEERVPSASARGKRHQPGEVRSTGAPSVNGVDAVVRVGQREGRLLLDRQADRGPDHARIRYDDGTIAEVLLSDLHLAALRDRRSA
ncbi:ParB/RepB/Spo0J family partition protein [Methylobacterium iners]|uniref:Nucleoid occlusion protein n=1 Tax=Methylobacterium iners TaxID=418707 RepID=A0ABQ4RXZ2_9HYPH|nr:ParB/RepB/Spo0J family partition protein [Methylobacterium iners]GJD94452.1 Nucleoid occlusion protein [Methylobacterium iners]